MIHQHVLSYAQYCLIWLLLPLKLTEADEGKIIGGRLAQPGEFPFALCMYGGYRCGAALISMKRFITAGHCFIYKGKKQDISQQKIVAGVVDCTKKDDPYFQERRIVHYLVHPELRNKKDKLTYHDFSVGILDKPFIESERVKAGKIPSYDPDKFRQFWVDYVKSGKTCTAMGYGAQQGKDGPFSMQWGNDMRVIEVQPKDDKFCQGTTFYDTDKVLDGEVCAVAVKPTKESMAPGDSGTGFACGSFLIGVNTGGAFDKGINLQLFTLAYPYLKLFTMDSAFGHSAHFTVEVIGLLTVYSVSVIHQ